MPIACPGFIASHYPGLCRAVDHYCERIGPAFDAEPVNAISNAAFLVSSAAAWRLSQRQTPPRAAEGLTQILIAMIAVIGLGSFLFHTVGNRWTEWADVLPILLFMLLYLWLVLTLFFASPVWLKLAAVTLLSAATVGAEAYAPPAFLWGGALYLPAALTLIAFSIAIGKVDKTAARGLAAATAVFVLSFTARTLDMPLCDLWPLGTHFLWHLLNAALLYLLVRVAIVHRYR